MPVVKITLSQDAYEKLQGLAGNQSVQDYIRGRVFGTSIFTVDEAVKRILAGEYDDPEKYPDGFELPEVYGEDWTIPRGPAGVFGKQFYRHVVEHPELGIGFKGFGKYGRRAKYTLRKGEEHNEQQANP